jgi:hypothetical protein
MSLNLFKMITTLKELSESDYEYRKNKNPTFGASNGMFYRKYSEKDANKLTDAIKRWFELSDGQVSRVNSQGQYDPRTKKMRFSHSTRGAADLSCIYQGRAIEIEIKFGKDRQSDVQKEYQEKVERAKGIYLIVRTWEDFIQQMSKVV